MVAQLTVSDHSFAGAVSGLLTRFLLQPLDVLKIRFQLQVEPIHRGVKSSKYRSIYQALKCIYAEEGFAAFWKGHVPAQGLSVIYGSVQFASFALFKEKLFHSESTNSHVTHFVCGGLAGCSSTIIVQPLDLLRTRLVAQGEPKEYKGITDASVKIMRNEGARGFYKGLAPTLIQIAPYAGAQFAFYKFFNEIFEIIITSENLGISTNLVSGAFAGLAAKTITYPLDVVKKRLQIQGFEKPRMPFGAVRTYKGMMNCFRIIFIEERLMGIYKGLTPSLLKAILATSFHFAFYEQACQILLLTKS